MIIWIASYPKSGNTWIRALLATYLNFQKNEFNFNILSNIPRFTQDKFFSSFINLEELKHDPLKISEYWQAAQSRINLDKKIKFLKTHNACVSANGNLFTDRTNSLGYIYIVRDPRSIACSYAKHMNISNENSVKKIINKDLIGFYGKNNLVEVISSWKINYLSWKKKKKFSGILIKYEDLIDQTENEFTKILMYLKDKIQVDLDKSKIEKTIEFCKFSNLRALEEKNGFSEATNGRFFRKGQKYSWKTELNSDLQKIIEKNFKKEMIELSYL